jgi:hypothetical protein
VKKTTILKLCKENGLESDSEKFAKFFMKRFPNESDLIHSYCIEWIKRFNTGSPERYMDRESQRIYNEVNA